MKSNEFEGFKDIFEIQSRDESVHFCDNITTDIEEFRKRVRSFEPPLWLAKPKEISPLICSQHGFKCSSKDKIECVSCGNLLCFKDDFFLGNTKKEIYHKLFFDSLKKRHTKECPFLRNICPSEFLLHNSQVSGNRRKCLLDFRRELYRYPREVSIKINSNFLFEMEEKEIMVEYKRIFQENDERYKAFLLTLFDWNVRKVYLEKKRIHVSCKYCQAERFVEVGTSSSSSSSNTTEILFHPREFHRFWCPSIVNESFRFVVDILRKNKEDGIVDFHYNDISDVLNDSISPIFLMKNKEIQVKKKNNIQENIRRRTNDDVESFRKGKRRRIIRDGKTIDIDASNRIKKKRKI